MGLRNKWRVELLLHRFDASSQVGFTASNCSDPDLSSKQMANAAERTQKASKKKIIKEQFHSTRVVINHNFKPCYELPQFCVYD